MRRISFSQLSLIWKVVGIGTLLLIMEIPIASASKLKFREPPSLPPALLERQFVELGKRRETLVEQFKSVNSQRLKFNDGCRKVKKSDVPKVQQCRQDEPVIRRAMRAYGAALKKWEKDVDHAEMVAKLEQDIDRLSERIKSHQQAIRNLGFPTSVQQFKEWHDLSEAAKEDFKKAAISAVFAEGFIAAQSTLKVVKSLNPPKANTLVRELKEAGINSPELFKLIRKVALVKGKPEMAKDIKPVLKRSSELVDIALLDKGPTMEAKLRGLATLLSWFVEAPVLNKFLARGDFAVTTVYSFYTIHEVGIGVAQLTKITEQQLEGLEGIVALMKKDMKSLKDSQEKLRILHSHG